ncbi:MAG: sugar ABC transporter permease [Candidatus Methanomethylicia archaeon]
MKKINIAYIYILPALLLFLFFLLLPIILEVYIALSEIVPGSVGLLSLKFTGLGNVFILLNDPNYIKSLLNTFIFLIVNINVKMALALLVALALNRGFIGKRLVMALLIIPWAMPEVPYYLAWRFLYHPDFGFLTYIFDTFFGGSPNWLGDSRLSLYSVMIAHVFKYVPFWTLIFLAALQSIPVELYDATKVDGAGAWDTFRYITLPLIKNITIINYTLSFVWMMGEFNSVWILTQGGPSYASHLIASYAYVKTFLLLEWNAGAAAFVIVLPIIIVLITLILRGGLMRLGG